MHVHRFAIIAAAGITAFSGAADAASFTIFSDANTLAAASSDLSYGASTGLSYTNAAVGDFGSFTPVPNGAPAGTQIINIPPGDGQSGFFKINFDLPSDFTGAALSGAGNVDDNGIVYLNGHVIGEPLDQFSSKTFASMDQSYFHAGLNEFLVSDNNSGGGPSAASFYANVSYSAGPGAPAPLLGLGLLPALAGAGSLGLTRGRRRKAAV